MIRVALLVLAAAVALLVWASLRAVHVATPAVAASADSSAEAPGAIRRPLLPARRIVAAVDKDPFHPQRRRPAQRFQVTRRAPVATRSPEPSVRVVGTAVGPEGGFAMCSWAGGAPRIVRVGDRLGDWTLSKVMPGAAEFADAAGSTVVVRIAKAGT